MTLPRCLACQSDDLTAIFTSPNCPRASHKFARVPQTEASRVDIAVYECRACGVVQLDRPYEEEYADDYQRNTSFSPSAVRFMHDHVALVRAAVPAKDATALEIGCGDGTFLALLGAHFRARGLEPSRAATALARAKGLDVENQYFDAKSFTGDAFDVVVLRFVLEHIFDLKTTLEALHRIVKPGGACMIEVPNYAKMVKDVRFFEFFREHVLYFDAASLTATMARHGFRLLRAHPFMNDEYLFGIFQRAPDPPPYQASCERIARALTEMIASVDGGDVAFWGASGGGVSLLSYGAIPLERVRYIVDSDPNKHGLHVFGVGARIVPPAALREGSHPRAVIILSPAYEEEITKTLRDQYAFEGRIGSIRGVPHWVA